MQTISIVTKSVKSVYRRLTLKTINKIYASNYNELVTQVKQQQHRYDYEKKKRKLKKM